MIIIIKNKKVKGKDKRKFVKGNKFEKFFKFFNVHINLHFANNVKKYVMMMNSNIMIEELKHKLFVLFPHYRKN